MAKQMLTSINRESPQKKRREGYVLFTYTIAMLIRVGRTPYTDEDVDTDDNIEEEEIQIYKYVIIIFFNLIHTHRSLGRATVSVT